MVLDGWCRCLIFLLSIFGEALPSTLVLWSCALCSTLTSVLEPSESSRRARRQSFFGWSENNGSFVFLFPLSIISKWRLIFYFMWCRRLTFVDWGRLVTRFDQRKVVCCGSRRPSSVELRSTSRMVPLWRSSLTGDSCAIPISFPLVLLTRLRFVDSTSYCYNTATVNVEGRSAKDKICSVFKKIK